MILSHVRKFIEFICTIEEKKNNILCRRMLTVSFFNIYRFLPIQMFFVGCSTLLPLLGDGPTWHENIDPIVEGCKRDWWANMIFINNLYRSTEDGVSGRVEKYTTA